MKIIFDVTSSSEVRVLLVENGKIRAEQASKKTRESSSFFLKATQKVLKDVGRKKEEITGVFIAEGAASFTTVRIGTVVGNALAFGLDLPVMGQFMKRSLREADLEGIDRALSRKHTFTESYAPHYFKAPTITKPKPKI